jgi:glycosyltransferase involved in cell wall biosynthesis
LLLLESEPRAFLRVVGSAPYAKGLLRLLDRLPQGRFEYLPRVEREGIPDLLRRTDLLVQPSEQEDFGSSVAEALACGTTAVLGPTNGTRAYIGDAAFPFESYTAEAVAAAMRRAVQAIRRDPEQVRRRARQAAEREFGLPAMVDRLERLTLEAQLAHAGTGQLGTAPST